MTVTLTGSRAMAHWFSDARKPNGDWDWHADGPGTMPKWFDGACVPGVRHDVFVDERLGAWNRGPVATPDELYTIKISHSFWEVNGSANWNKHACDIVFLSRHGAQFIRELYDILLPIWKERYRKNTIKLQKPAVEFFDDAVHRTYDHDSLHESVAYGARPLYESILREGSDVAVDNSKFRAMDHATQIRMVREEIYATALERKLIPDDYRGSPRSAYHWALRRTATSLFKGEWALFLMLNLDELMVPDCDYKARHLANKHKLRLIGEKNV